jgi:hypothetical protein
MNTNALILAASLAFASPSFAEPARHLFLDPETLASSENVTLKVNPAKDQRLVIVPDKEWEKLMISFFLTVIDEGDKLRMWYLTRDIKNRPHVAYAESVDGLKWTKPNLGVFSYNGSTDNNLVNLGKFDGMIYKDPKAKSPAEKYIHIGNVDLPKDKVKGTVRFTSPDGLTWKPDPKPLLPFRSDTQNVVFWDSRLGEYALYLRGWDLTPGWSKRIRTVVRATAPRLDQPLSITPSGKGDDPKDNGDGVYLPRIVDELPVVLAADGQDRPNSDFYNIAAQPYPLDPSWYVGFPSFFAREKSMIDGKTEVQFVGSRDGVKWNRYDRTPYVTKGAPGSETEGMAYICPNIIVRGDELWQYGTCYRGRHGDVGARKKQTDGAIYRYVQRIDGFVSADFENKPGTIVMKPVTVDGPRLLLNVATHGSGNLRVALLDESGKPIPGFAESDCAAVTGDSLALAVGWKSSGDLTAFKGRKVSLRFSGTDAKLYAFYFGKAK